MVARYGADTPILVRRDRLICSGCGGRQVDMVVTGTVAAIASNVAMCAIPPLLTKIVNMASFDAEHVL